MSFWDSLASSPFGSISGLGLGLKAFGFGNKPPATPDYNKSAQDAANASKAAVAAQTTANRPDQSNPFGFSNWTQGPDGQWHQQSGLSPELQGTFGSMTGQAGSAWGSPLDNGAQARQHAEDAIYQRESSRLDPMWNQRQEQMRSQLVNQGFDPSSEAYQHQMDDFGRSRNDAYQTAMDAAIQGGGAEASRQQGMDLQSRMAPLNGMNSLRGLSQPFDFKGAGLSQTPDYMGAAGMNYQGQLNNYNANQAQQQQGVNTFASFLPFMF